jgi:arginase family enzyme
VLEKAIDEALDGPKYIYLSLDIDVLDRIRAEHGHARASGPYQPRAATGYPPHLP